MPAGSSPAGIKLLEKGVVENMYMEERLEWEYKGQIIHLFLDDIYYICSEDRKTYIHAKNGTYQIGTSVKQEAERLRHLPFVRIHNAYLVHLKHLECIGHHEAVLRSGDRIPVSERRERLAKQEIRKYLDQLKIQKNRAKLR